MKLIQFIGFGRKCYTVVTDTGYCFSLGTSLEY